MSHASLVKRNGNGTGAERFRFARLLFVGAVAAVANILSRIAFNLVMSYEAAIVVAYMCGMTIAYALNKLFVFAPSGRAMHDEYVRFTIVNLLSLTLVWTVSVGLAFVRVHMARQDHRPHRGRERAGDHKLFRASTFFVRLKK